MQNFILIQKERKKKILNESISKGMFWKKCTPCFSNNPNDNIELHGDPEEVTIYIHQVIPPFISPSIQVINQFFQSKIQPTQLTSFHLILIYSFRYIYIWLSIHHFYSSICPSIHHFYSSSQQSNQIYIHPLHKSISLFIYFIHPACL